MLVQTGGQSQMHLVVAFREGMRGKGCVVVENHTEKQLRTGIRKRGLSAVAMAYFVGFFSLTSGMLF